MQVLLIAVFAVVAIVQIVSAQEKIVTPVAPAAKPVGAIKCYVCNSLTKGQENCESSDEELLKPYLKSCPKITEGQLTGRPATMCRKILQDVHEKEGTVRECAYTGEDELDGKRRIGNKGIILYLYQCINENDKACNSASGMNSIVALSIGLIAAFFAKFFN